MVVWNSNTFIKSDVNLIWKERILFYCVLLIHISSFCSHPPNYPCSFQRIFLLCPYFQSSDFPDSLSLTVCVGVCVIEKDKSGPGLFNVVFQYDVSFKKALFPSWGQSSFTFILIITKWSMLFVFPLAIMLDMMRDVQTNHLETWSCQFSPNRLAI